MYKNEEVKRTVIYEGLFIYELDEYGECGEYPEWYRRTEPLNEATLAMSIANPHVTIAYKPSVTHEKFYGRRVYVIVNGYGNDGTNEGYSVDIIPDKRDYYDESSFNDFCSLFSAEDYHITLSVSEDGRPVDTGKLKFSELPMNRQKVYECRFGAFVANVYSDGTKDTQYITHQ